MTAGPVMSAAVSAVPGVVMLAQQEDTGGRGADFGKSSPVGLLLLVLFLIAVFFLVRSMTKHLRRVPATFERTEESDGEPAENPSDEHLDGRHQDDEHLSDQQPSGGVS